MTQRAKEISIRLALGAGLATIVTLVMRHSLRLASIGLVGGAFIALGAGRFFGWCGCVMMLKMYDPLAYVVGTLVVVAACLVASSVPALRAARLDPVQTLRAD